MDIVYILYEERESSPLCEIKGVWGSREKAIAQMKILIASNTLYSEFSEINYDEGYSESDPMYSGEIYSNYYIKSMEKL